MSRLIGYQLINNHQNVTIKNYLDSYLKNKPPDCFLYSEDGTEFKIHKEVFGQTKFMRELLKCSSCCGTIEIICPCSIEELRLVIDFVIHGKIQCENERSIKSF